MERQVKLIGSDLFPQSRELLSQGKLHAVIDKRPGMQAYLAAQLLINYVLWNSLIPFFKRRDIDFIHFH